MRLSRLILILHLKCFLFRFMWFFVFLLKAMIFGWLISINYLFGFNIKHNGIRYYNFDIVPCFELSVLLLLRESHIATQIWNLVCLPHNMVFVYIFVVYIIFKCVCVYNYWEFCFINLRIVNYFIGFGNYALATMVLKTDRTDRFNREPETNSVRLSLKTGNSLKIEK